MPKPPKLTDSQKNRLAILEPRLRAAVRIGNYELAKTITQDIQGVLRRSGHETRLMQAKNWLFEAAMESGNTQIAVSGFQGIRDKSRCIKMGPGHAKILFYRHYLLIKGPIYD